jgi:hypothetical protein
LFFFTIFTPRITAHTKESIGMHIPTAHKKIYASKSQSRLKQFFLTAILALTCLLPNHTHALTRGEKGGTFLLASILLSMNKNRLGESAFTKKIATLTNTDNHDLVDASVLSAYYWAWSYLYESIGASSNGTMWHSWATDLRYQATIQPLIQIVATSKIYNKLFKNTPGLSALACSDSECQGVCDACEYKHLVRKAILEVGIAVTPTCKFGEAQGNCVLCLEENVQIMPSMCQGAPCQWSKDLCHPCSLRLLNAAQPRCPGCRAGLTPYLSASSVPLTKKLYHIAFWEPFWTACRRDNNFLHRWGLELRKINPLVQRHISCKNRHKHSICHQCKLKKIFHIHDWAKYLVSRQ